ncbi:MAG: XrtA system polysaccharide deacetylase [Gemmatimonadota bacterium]
MTKKLFTVDVEEYFQVGAMEPYVSRDRWAEMPSRVERGVDLLLELLAERGATGTFFTLGCVAERNPDVVRRIAAAGHEVASHGWTHRRVTSLSPKELRTELARSRDVLSDLSGKPVLGFRAPNFSIVSGWEWAFDLLLEEGYRYDSSVFPGRHGRAAANAGVHWIRRTKGELLEIPMTPASLGPVQVPAGGGAWFRLLPYGLTARALKQATKRGHPGVFYIHPWELDLEQPRIAVNAFTRTRHYGGLARTVPRLRRLFREFEFISVRQWLEQDNTVPARVAA